MANDKALTIELWTEFGIGLFFLFLRAFARWKTVGAANLYWDDLFSLLSAINWILETTLLYTLGLFGHNIGLNEKTAMEIPDDKVPRIKKGSMLAFWAWIFYIALVWSLKGTLLFFYNRLTMGLWQHRLVKIMGICSIATFVASMLLHLCQCTPIRRNWQVKPYAGDNCTLRTHNYIVIEVLNVLTDIVLIAIPIPIVFASQLPLHRKIVLSILFSSGGFVMIAAVLRAYYSVKNIETLNVALGWASREVFVATIAVSAPSIKPLFGRKKWSNKKSKDTEDSNDSSNPKAYPPGSPWSLRGGSTKSGGGTNIATVTANRRCSQDVELGPVSWFKRFKRNRSGVRELGHHYGSENKPAASMPADKNPGITVTTEFMLEHENVEKAPAAEDHPTPTNTITPVAPVASKE